MEWILQVVDEIDDAIAVVRHGWLSVQAYMAVVSVAVIAAASVPLSAAALKGRAIRSQVRS
jgi:hypothetical protein